MHLAEGVLPLGQAIAWSATGTIVLAWSMHGELQDRQNPTALPSFIISGVTSLLFAVTLLPLPVPVVGATSHICLTPIFALFIGVRRIVWPTFFVLLLQAIFFAHGGITTLGINMITLGVIGPICTVSSWKFLRTIKLDTIIGLAIACAVGDLSIYVADALVLSLALTDLSNPMTTFIGVVIGFAPVQLPLAILESAVSVSIIRLLADRRSDFLPNSLKTFKKLPAPLHTICILSLLVGTSGCEYKGIDETVFSATAETAGQLPADSIIDLSGGELGLAMSILILFGLGFVAGRVWERLVNGKSDALSR